MTKKLNSVTTNTSTYDNADQLSSDGSISYAYHNNGNTTAAGTSNYTWDYANRITGAAVGGTSSTYAYAGDDVRASKTVGGNTTSYLWDRESGLPMLVGDGTNRYLHADNLIAEVDNANAAKYHVGDALGSVRGLRGYHATAMTPDPLSDEQAILISSVFKQRANPARLR